MHKNQREPFLLSLSTLQSPEMGPVHLTVNILPSEFRLAIDLEARIVTLLYGPADQAASRARILRHRSFTPNGIRVVSVLLSEPDFCPLEYLLAALRASPHIIHSWLLFSSSSDHSQLEHVARDIASFERFADEFAERIDGVAPGDEREMLLRPMRHTMSEVIAGLESLGIFVFTLRTIGYRLQQIPPHQMPHSRVHRKSPGTEAVRDKTPPKLA